MGTHHTSGLYNHIFRSLLSLCSESPLNRICVNKCVSWKKNCPSYFLPFLKIQLQTIKNNYRRMDSCRHIRYWACPILSPGIYWPSMMPLLMSLPRKCCCEPFNIPVEDKLQDLLEKLWIGRLWPFLFLLPGWGWSKTLWDHTHSRRNRVNHEWIDRVGKLAMENISALRVLIKLPLLLVPGWHCSESSLGEFATQISKK